MKEITMKAPLVRWSHQVLSLLRNLGPYAAIELLLPGGTLIALALWVYRHRTHVQVRS
jgi:hypothetical protein